MSNMFIVWSDNESKISLYKEFTDLELACQFASAFVHQFDDADYRVILYIEHNDETIDCYENLNNPCDYKNF